MPYARSSIRRCRPWGARLACLLATAALATSAAHAQAGAAAPQKVLRYAMEKAETGFEPAQVPDAYSREIIDNIIEPPLRYDLLARPLKLRVATAAALPEMSADSRELTLRIRPGIFFADDPAFHGQARELTAADYAYTLRRHFDPRLHSVAYADLLGDDILGLQALRERAESRDTPFDYDAPVEGLRVIDRYTLRIRFGHPSPRFALKLAESVYAGAIAREVAEAYGDAIMEHPVGTGPYRLVQWRRSSFIALERNPRFRDESYDEQPAADDADGQATAALLHGRREPMVDRVEVSIIEAPQPSWLAYLGGAFDMTLVPYLSSPTAAAPGGRLAANLARRRRRSCALVPQPDVTYTYFNMEDPVVGGYAPERVALRRAIALGYDNAEEIRLLRQPLAIPAQGLVAPLVTGYDPGLPQRHGRLRPGARAKALLGCTATSTSMATASASGPTAVRWCCTWRRAPDHQPRASLVSCGRRRWARSRLARRVRAPPMARADEAGARRASCGCGRWAGRPTSPTRKTCWRSPTAPARAKPTGRASTCRNTTPTSAASASCPTAPNARRPSPRPRSCCWPTCR